MAESDEPARFLIQLVYDGAPALVRRLADTAVAHAAEVDLATVSADRSLIHVQVWYSPDLDGEGSLTAALDTMEKIHTLALELGVRAVSAEPTDLDAQRRIRIRPPQAPPPPLSKPG